MGDLQEVVISCQSTVEECDEDFKLEQEQGGNDGVRGILREHKDVQLLAQLDRINKVRLQVTEHYQLTSI